jgi:hypothetical protein
MRRVQVAAGRPVSLTQVALQMCCRYTTDKVV